MMDLFYDVEDDVSRMLQQSVANAFNKSPAGLTTADLDELGWTEYAESSLLSAVAIVALEQGRCLGSSAAQDYAAAMATGGTLARFRTTTAVALNVERHAAAGIHWASRAVGAPDAERFLLVGPESATVVERSECVLVPARSIDPSTVIHLVNPVEQHETLSCNTTNYQAVWRVISAAMSFELLGACEHILRSAVTYAKERHQFGKAIGAFQAVQMLVADAAVDFAAAKEVMTTQINVSETGDPDGAADCDVALGLAVKAAATSMASAQQVFGAIGYTAEHHLHRYIKRCLVLTELANPSALACRVGESIAAAALKRSAPETSTGGSSVG